MGIEQFLLQRAKKEGIGEGIEKGIERGIEKGIDIQLKETIKNAQLKKNFSIETIANLANLKPKRVRHILDDLGIE